MVRRSAPLLLLLCFGMANSQTSDLERITGLAKTFFRDSAELPMDVAVTTTVKNADGKVKREGHANVHMLFHGYSHTGKFSLNAKAGFRDRREMFDSLNGDIAAFSAGMILTKPKDNARFDVQSRDESGRPSAITISDGNCPEFKLNPGRMLFPDWHSLCGTATFTLSSDPSGDPIFRHFTFENAGLPAQAKVGELGNAQVTAFRIEEDFQSWTMPGETKPFLLPQQVQVFIKTNKGGIEFLNRYTPSAPK